MSKLSIKMFIKEKTRASSKFKDVGQLSVVKQATGHYISDRTLFDFLLDIVRFSVLKFRPDMVFFSPLTFHFPFVYDLNYIIN